MSRFTELRELLGTSEVDFSKFYEKGNRTAGTRLRKQLHALRARVQDIRKEIQEIKTMAKLGTRAR